MYWKNKTGTHAYRAAEILNIEDDMAGTAAYPCTVSTCMHKVLGGDWTEAVYGEYDKVEPTNDIQWHIYRIAADAVRIWDVYPR